ncbi:MAG: DNA topoisomerase IV subunit A [Candidatus Krumholzibacteriota bacterium]
MAKKKTTKKKTAKKKVTKKAAKKPASSQAELSFGTPGRKKKAPARKAAGKKAAPKKKAPAKKPAAAAAKSGPPRTKTTGTEPRKASFSPVSRRIRSESNIIRQKILLGDKPSMKFPLRSLANVNYSSSTGYFKLKGKKKERTLTVNTVKTFAQTLKMMALSKELIETDDIATKREAYYVSKNWSEARFKEQPESDTVMEDVEAFFSVNREQLGFVPEEKGGDVAGRLVVIDHDRDSGEELRIDCTRFGSGAYSIPISVEDLKFETDAQFILCIETAGMFQRLVKHNYWKTANCILISLGGVPTRACRRFVRRLADSHGLPVYVFVDGDPYGFSNIYRTLKVGSGNAAHLNEYFCVPQAHLLGITPQDIIDYDLPTHPLKDVDIKRAKDALKNDPFILHYRAWQLALEQMIKMGVRAEQQALAKHGLNYVIDEYLPQKLANVGRFLP